MLANITYKITTNIDENVCTLSIVIYRQVSSIVNRNYSVILVTTRSFSLLNRNYSVILALPCN